YLSRQFAGVNQLASSKSQLKKRIECIAAFTSETKAVKLKSILIFILLAGVVAGQIPIVSAMSDSNDRMDFNNKQEKYEDLSSLFIFIKGIFVMYDLYKYKYNIYNIDKSTLLFTSNSTYKIYSALFALDFNFITRNDNSMKWNGKLYPYQNWN